MYDLVKGPSLGNEYILGKRLLNLNEWMNEWVRIRLKAKGGDL